MTHVEIDLIKVAIGAEDDVHVVEAGYLARDEAGDGMHALIHTFLCPRK